MKLIEQPDDCQDPEPKAIACYGAGVHWYDAATTSHEEVWLRFVEGNPCSNSNYSVFGMAVNKTQQAGKKALVMLWDNARWHKKPGSTKLDKRTQSEGEAAPARRSITDFFATNEKPLAQPN